MICENCKERPASITITQESMGGSWNVIYVRSVLSNHRHSISTPIKSRCPFSSFYLTGLAVLILSGTTANTGRMLEGPECPSCGLTFPKFLDIGKFGCADCYDTFRGNLPHVFGKLHNGHSTHTGKIPVSFNEIYAVKKKIEEIRVKMKEAVEAEHFEEAAALRDEANTLKQHLSLGGEENDVD